MWGSRLLALQLPMLGNQRWARRAIVTNATLRWFTGEVNVMVTYLCICRYKLADRSLHMRRYILSISGDGYFCFDMFCFCTNSTNKIFHRDLFKWILHDTRSFVCQSFPGAKRYNDRKKRVIVIYLVKLFTRGKHLSRVNSNPCKARHVLKLSSTEC